MAESKYRLMSCFDNINEYVVGQRMEVGKIVNKETNEAVLYIVYDQDDYKSAKYRIHTEIIKQSDKSYLCAIINEDYLNMFIQKPKIFMAIAFHELGHFINGDYNNSFNNKELMNNRVKYVENNKVIPMELNADKFAVNELGKTSVINAIDYLILLRKKRNDDGMQLAIKEFELRKAAIKRM